MKAPTIGADPELFICDANDKIIPICGLLGGTKGAPIDIGGGIGLQEDNVMAEFNIPACTGPAEFHSYIESGVARVLAHVQKAVPGARIATRGEWLFRHDELTHPQAMMFGCQPDFNAYTKGTMWPPLNPATLNKGDGAMRFAGGHVHLGYKRNDEIPDFVAAAFGDMFIGLGFVEYDRQPERRSLYGQPGRYRPTAYGIEYRTLSNFWVTQHHEYAEDVGNAAIDLCTFLGSVDMDVLRSIYREAPWRDVREAILKEDAGLAARLLNHFRHDPYLTGYL